MTIQIIQVVDWPDNISCEHFHQTLFFLFKSFHLNSFVKSHEVRVSSISSVFLETTTLITTGAITGAEHNI